MENFKKNFKNIDTFNILIKKGFYNSMKTDIEKIEYYYSNILLISYEYIDKTTKNIITARICEIIPNLQDFFNNLIKLHECFHLNYIFSINNNTSLSISNNDFEKNIKKNYIEIFNKFYKRNNLIPKNNNSYNINHYIFNRKVLNEEFIMVINFIKPYLSKIIFINESIYYNFISNF